MFKCITDALLAGSDIESVVEHFIAQREWPTLSEEHTIYLLHRAIAARNLLNDLIAQPEAIAIIKPPALDDRSAMLRWLFLTTWNMTGADYMKRWAENYLAANPAPGAAQKL